MEPFSGDFRPKVAIVNPWAFWVQPWMPGEEQKFMVAPYDAETEHVLFEDRRPVDVWTLNTTDVQGLFGVLDFLAKEENEDEDDNDA